MFARPTFLSFFFAAALVSAYREGAPQEACRSRHPQHDGRVAQNGWAHFALHVEETYDGGYKVTLANREHDKYFSGFIIQATRRTSYGNREEVIGYFDMDSTNSDVKELYCEHTDRPDTVTHNDNNFKDRISVVWHPGNDLEDDVAVTFKATVVEEKHKFWTDIESEPVYMVDDYYDDGDDDGNGYSGAVSFRTRIGHASAATAATAGVSTVLSGLVAKLLMH